MKACLLKKNEKSSTITLPSREESDAWAARTKTNRREDYLWLVGQFTHSEMKVEYGMNDEDLGVDDELDRSV